MKLQCKSCGEERDIIYFRRRKVKGKYYYVKSLCKICLRKNPLSQNISLGKPKKLKDVILSKEDKVFLNSIKMGYVDMLNAYKLADCYIRYFGDNIIDMEVESELILMYERLKRFMEKEM